MNLATDFVDANIRSKMSVAIELNVVDGIRRVIAITDSNKIESYIFNDDANISDDSHISMNNNINDNDDLINDTKSTSSGEIAFYKSNKVKNYDIPDEYLNLYDAIIKKHDRSIKPTSFFVLSFLNIVKNNILKREGSDIPDDIDIVALSQRISRDLPVVMELDFFYSYLSDALVTLSSHHGYYGKLASYICAMRIHSITAESLLDTANLLQNNIDCNNDHSPILGDEIIALIRNNHERLQEHMVMDRDFDFDYFGLKTLERSYLQKLQFTKYKIIERPQHMIMRVALGIHGSDIDAVIETYDMMSQRLFTHATPTLFNAGTIKQQLSSCFLHAFDDNLESIMNEIRDIALTSKMGGGIGGHLSALRCRGSLIRGTNGISSGIIPLCVMIDKEAKYINQGGKRNGSVAIYLEPWHGDIYDFCDLRKDTGNDDNRAYDLFLALWVPDLFMKRVKDDQVWSLMCPDACPGLNMTHSGQFDRLYEQYEKEGRFIRQVKARHLWKHIIASQGETGFPYFLYKDHANAKSNQQNLGTIRSSNLCAEIIEYSDADETAVCNLASVCLPRFVKKNVDGTMSYDHMSLMKIVRVVVRNLDKIIDRNYYPTEKTKRSNMRHRPMGIGVQGLADLYNMMGYAFDSSEAIKLNKEVFESIYYAAIGESVELAKKLGSYSTFAGSEFSKGRLQYHLWGLDSSDLLMGYDWERLIGEVQKYGTRNSLLTAVMPTASTSQIMGNSECCEPRMSNVFTRTTLAGMFVVVNPFLMDDLMKEGLWNEDMRKKIIIHNGSVQKIEEIPHRIKEIYKTAYEINQMHLVKQSADRGVFIDQSQSFNLFFAKPNFDLQTAALFGGWEAGLKTGEYYLRTQPAVNPIQFGIDIDDIKRLTGRENIRDFISGDYGNVNDIGNRDSFVDKPVASSNDIDGLSKVSSSPANMCQWKPGMKKPDDCLMCGA